MKKPLRNPGKSNKGARARRKQRPPTYRDAVYGSKPRPKMKVNDGGVIDGCELKAV